MQKSPIHSPRYYFKQIYQTNTFTQMLRTETFTQVLRTNVFMQKLQTETKIHNGQAYRIEFWRTDWWLTQLKLWTFIYLCVRSTLPWLSQYYLFYYCPPTSADHFHEEEGVSGPTRIPQSSSQHFAIRRMNASIIVVHHLPLSKNPKESREIPM